MNPEIERNLGEQPMAQIMREHYLKPHDLVALSSVRESLSAATCNAKPRASV